jgi:uncharacterized protein YbjT (DUF2867 family)
MNNRILITGATGRVGAEILRQLPAGTVIRAGVRQPEAARQKLKRTDVEYVTLDFEQPTTFAPALQGVTHVFLMWPAVKTDYVLQFIAAAEQARVQHVVFLSIIVAEQLSFLAHRKVEKRLEASAMSYTFLRASYFMQNLDTIHAADLRERHELFIPAGQGTVNLVDVRDVAAVGVQALTEETHLNQAYRLMGNETLSFSEVAARFSEVLQRQIRFTDPAIPSFMWRMTREHGYPLALVFFMVVEYTAARFHLGTQQESDLPRLLNRVPISLRQYIHDFQAVWR